MADVNIRESELLQKIKTYLLPLLMAEPIMESGSGAVVKDINGREYIDCAAGPGVLNTGHCHPKVVEAIQKQVAKMSQDTGRYYNIPLIELAEKLASIAPGDLKRSFFCNSGAEANEAAIKIALRYTSRQSKGSGIVALQRSFHGRLSLPVSLTGQSQYKKGFGSYASFPGIIHIPAPYCYRCPLTYPGCDIYCAWALEEAIKCSAQGELSIFICEPILGVGGVIVPPDEYLPRIVEICRKHDILVIFDEIFVGSGRTGKMFACEHWGCVPDIMAVAKAIGGGLPLGAVITRDEIADTLGSGDHNTTFGINNAACLAAGLAALQVLEEEGLVKRAAEMGDYTLGGLRNLMERHRLIGDIRGKGLMIGIEVVSDREKKTPAREAATKIRNKLLERGVIVHTTGIEGCVIRITPPLVITKDQIDQVLLALDSVLGDIEKGN